MKIIYLIPVLALVLASALPAGRYASLLEQSEGKRILAALARMEEERAVKPGAIEPLLEDGRWLIRLRCAEVIGRIGEPAGIPYLDRLLDDGDSRVVETALYSLGLIGGPDATESISRCLEKRSTGIKIRALQALGLAKDSGAIESIVPFQRSFHSELRAEALLAIAAIGDSTAGEACLISLKDPTLHVAACAVYAIGRLPYRDAAPDIIRYLESEDRELRFRTAEALGRLKEEEAVEPLAELLDDSDRIVAIKAAEALGRIGGGDAAEALVTCLRTADTHLKTVALRGIAKAAEGKSYEALLPLLTDDSPMVRAAAITAAAACGREHARRAIVRAVKTGTPAERLAATEGLGTIGAREDLGLLTESLLYGADHFTREGAAAGLGRWENRGDLETEITVRGNVTTPFEALLEAAGGDDWVVASIAIESLGKVGTNEHIDAIIRIFRTYTGRTDSDRRLAAITAATSIGVRSDEDSKTAVVSFLREASMDQDPRVARAAADDAIAFEVTIKPQPAGNWNRGDLPWGEPSLPLGTMKVLLETSRGEIEILLFGDDAPNIVFSIIHLARQGFYDGLAFHRVVPGFVIQGGCPRGDGWGDAEYYLRSQFNLHRYERGTVGMAHAGKDTAGSQIFITHTPQPHLDGRYTIIGTVTRGMEVVDRIETGDTFSMRVVE